MYLETFYIFLILKNTTVQQNKKIPTGEYKSRAPLVPPAYSPCQLVISSSHTTCSVTESVILFFGTHIPQG